MKSLPPDGRLTAPHVSVVIATCNRAARLGRLLDALSAQEQAPPFDVIIVDDASQDETQARLAGRSGDPFRLTVLRQPRRSGPAVARNRGWRESRAPVICFTDDDCRPEPGWLHGIVAPIGRGEADLVQGRTVPDPDDAANRGPFSRTIDIGREEGFYETCNMAYRRDVLDRAGGFDESFRYPYGEDADLAWRARQAGFRTAFANEAVVRHAIWPSDFRAQLRDMRRRDGLVLLYSKHPHLRAHFGRRVLFHKVHGPTIAAAAAGAGVVVRPRSPVAWAGAAAAGLWYAWVCHLVRPTPRHRWQWAVVVPLGFVVDAFEVAVMARASVRYRSLLL